MAHLVNSTQQKLNRRNQCTSVICKHTQNHTWKTVWLVHWRRQKSLCHFQWDELFQQAHRATSTPLRFTEAAQFKSHTLYSCRSHFTEPQYTAELHVQVRVHICKHLWAQRMRQMNKKQREGEFLSTHKGCKLWSCLVSPAVIVFCFS